MKFYCMEPAGLLTCFHVLRVKNWYILQPIEQDTQIDCWEIHVKLNVFFAGFQGLYTLESPLFRKHENSFRIEWLSDWSTMLWIRRDIQYSSKRLGKAGSSWKKLWYLRKIIIPWILENKSFLHETLHFWFLRQLLQEGSRWNGCHRGSQSQLPIPGCTSGQVTKA